MTSRNSRTTSRSSASTRRRETRLRALRGWVLRRLLRALPLLIVVALVLVGATTIAHQARRWLANWQTSGLIAPFFTTEVQYWGGDIARWAARKDIDPNLLATVMQIESCGHPDIASSAGAQGLFQVMPFHFETGEVYTDPETNARRAVDYLSVCYNYADGDPGLTLACYNGGPSVLRRSFHNWANETQRYYTWGVGIYRDATRFTPQSEALSHWLRAGGARLCSLASRAIGL